MRSFAVVIVGALLLTAACGDDEDASRGEDAGAGRGAAGSGGRGGAQAPEPPSGTLLALTYNVAGLPEGLSQSMPLRNTPIIGPLLNDYDLVFLQESWQTPDPNPVAPLRVYHEILVAASDHPYKTMPADQPLGADPRRTSALLSDGLNIFSRIPLGDTTREAWSSCVDTASDCLAFKGFSMTTAMLADGVPVHLYDLHMEAGQSAADDTARAAGIDQLLAFLSEHSSEVAVIIGGDFNLHTDTEPAGMQFARLLREGGLKDACTELQCEDRGSIDKLLFRDSARVQLTAEAWKRESELFVTSTGEPLSDHPPVSVRFGWVGVE